MSVLFCDLVGFTASAQAADPEDVRRMLDGYHGAVRSEIERFGGRVEKFIGDAVVGVWGAPIAFEDHAERAVRAGLAIVDGVDAEVRVAINTGEALVKLRARPELGEAVVAGDVINTASRLQAVAPVGGVVGYSDDACDRAGPGVRAARPGGAEGEAGAGRCVAGVRVRSGEVAPRPGDAVCRSKP